MTTTIATDSRTAMRPFTDVLAGLGGLVFVALLIIQNAIRSAEPGFAARPQDLITYFADHRTAAVVPLGLYPLGMVGLLAFAAGIRKHLAGGEQRFWADVGTFAVIVVAALFAVVNVTEITITARGTALAHSPAAVQVLWGLHGGAVGLNLVAIASALLGLSRAAAAQGLLPRWFEPIPLIGAACLFVAAVFTVAIVDGGAWLYLGFVGFIVWGVFLVLAGIALIRRRQPETT